MTELGRGQRVFESSPIVGELRILEGVADVLRLLDDGASGVVALVRDAGATFLAPLYHDLAGVLCTGGTLRSHIGIVTREFQVPCIMGVSFGVEPVDGATVEVDCSGPEGIVRAVG